MGRIYTNVTIDASEDARLHYEVVRLEGFADVHIVKLSTDESSVTIFLPLLELRRLARSLDEYADKLTYPAKPQRGAA